MKENREVTDTNVEDIEKAIERLEYIDRTYSCNNYYSIWDLKCIEILLSDYKRVLKENEELEEINNELEAEKNEAIRRYNFETIPIKKVKDKIKELKNISNAEELEDIMNRKNYTIAELVQYVLQELLERRKI